MSQSAVSAAALFKAREAFLTDDSSTGDDGPKAAPGPNSGWSDHHGGEMPATGDRRVLIRYRNGVVSEPILARERRWMAWPADLGDSDWDIVAWTFSDPIK